jgi:hypothetical protein
MLRAYDVATYPVAAGKLAGTEEWAKQAAHYSGGALWNNGTFVNRDIRGKPGQVSNHARGVAMDLSYRFMPNSRKGVTDGRRLSLQFMNTVIRHADTLGLCLAIDYWPDPFGRSWKCDRGTWQKAIRPTFTGAPKGDWWHVEITLELARNPEKVRHAFAAVFTTV